MTENTPYNFDIRIERVGKQFRTRVQSPAGESSGLFDTDPTSLNLEDFILKARQTASDSPDKDAIEQFGTALYNTVFTKEIDSVFRRSWEKARVEMRELRIRLRFDVPEFQTIPWEYLYHPDLEQFLALSNDTPLIRYIDLDRAIEPLTVRPPLKILVMISSPEGFPKLDVEKQWQGLNKALGPMIKRGLVELHRLEKPTLDQLQEALQEDNYHVFHYIGHGKYFEKSKEGKLLLEDDEGKGKAYSGDDLKTFLLDQENLRLVILSACEGARTSSEDPYSGVAQTLVLQGIPAVIAMQFEIFEDAAIKFSKKLYETIVEDGYPVEAAVSEARKAISLEGNKTEWGIPVLFTRSPDNVLFNKPDQEQPAGASAEKEPLSTSSSKPLLSTLGVNPKTLYLALIVIAVIVASITGVNIYRSKAEENTAATSTAFANGTATSVRAEALTTTADAISNIAAQGAQIVVANQTASAGTRIAAETATAADLTRNAPTNTSAITPSPTPITPSLSCLDGWTAISDDESLTIPDTRGDCPVAGYSQLGILPSNDKLIFRLDNFDKQGIYGLSAHIPYDVTIELQIDLTYMIQGEFWVALSNFPRPEKSMLVMAIQNLRDSTGDVRVYLNQSDTHIDSASGKALGSGPPYRYTFSFTTNGSEVRTRINSVNFRKQAFNMPQYLFLGFRNKSTLGYVALEVTVSNLKITENK